LGFAALAQTPLQRRRWDLFGLMTTIFRLAPVFQP